MVFDKSRRTRDPLQVAEAAFKAATTKPPEEPAPKRPSIPNAKELVSLRIDRDVLDYFQDEGPGWQDRINEALRKAAGKKSCPRSVCVTDQRRCAPLADARFRSAAGAAFRQRDLSTSGARRPRRRQAQRPEPPCAVRNGTAWA